MRLDSLVAFVVGLLALSVFSPVIAGRALAQTRGPTVDGAARAEARADAERAGDLYNRGQFEAALASYERAYARFPAPGLLFNLGQCHRELGQHHLAVERFERYLRERPEAANRALVVDLVAESRAHLGRGRAGDRASGGALTAQLERHAAALAELERTQRELDQAREASAERLATDRAQHEAAITELETARRALDEARARVDREAAERLDSAPEVYEEWWFWTILVGAIAAGVGITLGVVLTQEPGLPYGTLGTIDMR